MAPRPSMYFSINIWNSVFVKYIDDNSSHSFHPEGKLIATIGCEQLMITDVDTGRLLHHRKMVEYCNFAYLESWWQICFISARYNRCCWNPLPSSNSLAVTFRGHDFALIDTEKPDFKIIHENSLDCSGNSFMLCLNKFDHLMKISYGLIGVMMVTW